MNRTSIYLHIPFCRHRCSYCDFNTYAGQERWIPKYVQALRREIDLVAQSSGRRLPVHTVFFGGGTPSLLPAGEMSAIFETLHRSFDVAPDAEITLEANPGTVSLPYLQDLRQIGVNRLSYGMQSAHPDDLRLLEREHDFEDVVQAVEWSRQAGFDQLNLDLIFGVPYQTLQRWEETLQQALNLAPDHLSLYALTIEHRTPFFHWVESGQVPQPDDDLAAEMYETACERLDERGFLQYEISNWARRGSNGEALVCRHNLQYWHNLPYLGFGAGAHGFAAGKRTANVNGIQAFVKRITDGQAGEFPAGPAAATVTDVDRVSEMQETMMVGLRLTQAGVSQTEFQARFGETIQAAFPKEVDRLIGSGLLEWAGKNHDRLRLTSHGRLLGNQVFMHFVG
jgi:oxygen-independent coproporphyrinogen-3 oxidase